MWRAAGLARLSALVVVGSLALAGCASASTTSTAGSPAGTTTGPAAVTVENAWIKAADSGMTGAFGQIVNSSGADVVVASATAAVSPRVELHETVMTDGAMKMRPKEGGFPVAAGQTLTLEPGGNHIMLMDLAAPIKAGDSVPITLTLADGSTVTFEALAKTFTGAQESYAPSGAASGSMGGSPSMSGTGGG